MAPETQRGEVHGLFLKAAHGTPMQPAAEVMADADQGLRGDVSYGRTKRQVLLIESETLAEFELAPGDVRENVTVAGVRLAGLPEGTRLRLGDAELEVTMDCAPCSFMEDLRPGLRAATEGRRGTLARVVAGGRVRVGDSLVVEAVPREAPTARGGEI